MLWSVGSSAALMGEVPDHCETSPGSRLPTEPDDARVFDGFDLGKAEAIVTAVLAELPAAKAPEELGDLDVVHPIITELFAVIAKVADRAGVTMNKLFQGYYDASDADTNERADWVVTLPSEPAHSELNTLVHFEATGTIRCSMTKEDLLRQGFKHILQRLATKYVSVTKEYWDEDPVTRALGCVINGVDIVFIRLDFSATGVQCNFSVQPLMAREGLLRLVALLCDNEPAHFGMPHLADLLKVRDLGYDARLLGQGGFSTVASLTRLADGEEAAAVAGKFARQGHLFPHRNSRLEREEQVLRVLALHGVENVPRVEGSILDDAGGIRVLLLSPVGEGLEARIRALAPPAAFDLLARTYEALLRTVNHAAARGYHHGDIRPDNIIVVPAVLPKVDKPYLIHWGIATATGEAVGSPACKIKSVHCDKYFTPQRRLVAQRTKTEFVQRVEDDLAALWFTIVYLAVKLAGGEPGLLGC